MACHVHRSPLQKLAKNRCDADRVCEERERETERQREREGEREEQDMEEDIQKEIVQNREGKVDDYIGEVHAT